MRHIGLANTRQRLRHLYGGRAELRIDSVPGQGTAVIVELPLQAERSA
jgi:two-component system sensor histidine kinase YesM